MRVFAVFIIAIVLAGCGPTEPAGRPAKTPPRTARVRRAPPVSLGFVKSALTPRLRRLVTELKATQGKIFNFTALLKRYVPDIEGRLGKDRPAQARVQVVEVKRGHLIGALLRFTSKGWKPCSIDPDRYASQWLLSIGTDEGGKQRLTLFETKSRLFADNKAKVVFPPISKHVAIFHVTHSAKRESEQCEQYNMVTQSRRAVELYFVGRRGITRLNSYEVASSVHVPGNLKTSQTSIRWVRGAGHHLAYLILVSAKVDTNNETGGEVEGFNSTCYRTSSISALTKRGTLADLKGQALSAAEKRVPALAKMPVVLDYRIKSDKDESAPEASDCLKSKGKPPPARRAP